jgi:ATP dependent DNA ligase domain
LARPKPLDQQVHQPLWGGRSWRGRVSQPKPIKLPSGGQWLHEIKHDGFRIIARKDGQRVRLCSRPGNDLTDRFPLIVETLTRLRSRSCIIDGEAVACDDNGVACSISSVTTALTPEYSSTPFDLIELNGDDLRRDPLEVRRPRFEVCWPKLALACASTSISRATADYLRQCVQDGARRHRVEAEGLDVSLGALAGLAQDEELGCTGREAGGRRRVGQKEMAMNNTVPKHNP